MKVTIKELREMIRTQLNELTNSVFQEVQPSSDFKSSKNIKLGFDKLVGSFPHALALQIVVQNFPELQSKSPQEMNAAYDQQIGPYIEQVGKQFEQEIAQFVENKFVSAIKGFAAKHGKAKAA